MKSRIVAVAASLIAVLAVGVALVPGVFAQTPGTGNGNRQGATTSPSQGAYRQGQGMMGGQMGMGAGMMGDMRGGMMGGEYSLIAVAANELGMTRTELVEALGGTKSIAQVAAEHNVALNTVIDAFLAPRIENLNAAVAAGRMTQEQANQMQATMRTHVTEELNEVWTSHGLGEGNGFVDADNDGVCDNMPAGGQGRMGRGRGARP